MTDDDVLDQFLGALDRLGVEWTTVPWDELSAALGDAIEAPAVRGPWPFGEPPRGWADLPAANGAASLEEAQTGVTVARLAVADYGTIVLQNDGATETVSLLPERHVAVLRRSDLVPDMPAAFSEIGPLLRAEPTSLVLATGPSATADMGALVKGAHGPRVVHVIICTDR